MVLFGLGLYLPYVTVHTTVFERLLAMTREKGTIAFLLTLADSAGYLGYIGVMIEAEPGGQGIPAAAPFRVDRGAGLDGVDRLPDRRRDIFPTADRGPGTAGGSGRPMRRREFRRSH